MKSIVLNNFLFSLTSFSSIKHILFPWWSEPIPTLFPLASLLRSNRWVTRVIITLFVRMIHLPGVTGYQGHSLMLTVYHWEVWTYVWHGSIYVLLVAVDSILLMLLTSFLNIIEFYKNTKSKVDHLDSCDPVTYSCRTPEAQSSLWITCHSQGQVAFSFHQL